MPGDLRMIRSLTTDKPFTTGDVAKLCHVSPRTVTKWCDAGLIKHWRIPLSKDRRISRAALLDFLRQHEMPIPAKMETAADPALDS